MFWDKISPLYDLFEQVYNGKVYRGTGEKVTEFIEPNDTVLECACGTGIPLHRSVKRKTPLNAYPCDNQSHRND